MSADLRIGGPLPDPTPPIYTAISTAPVSAGGDKHDSQVIGVALVILGLVATATGCHFHWVELTTAASAVWGGGLMMLKVSVSKNPTL